MLRPEVAEGSKIWRATTNILIISASFLYFQNLGGAWPPHRPVTILFAYDTLYNEFKRNVFFKFSRLSDSVSGVKLKRKSKLVSSLGFYPGSVNHIPTRGGGRLCPSQYCLPPPHRIQNFNISG